MTVHLVNPSHLSVPVRCGYTAMVVRAGRATPLSHNHPRMTWIDGQTPRQRRAHAVIDEIVELRSRGCRFVAPADDNRYPATLADLVKAERQRNAARIHRPASDA